MPVTFIPLETVRQPESLITAAGRAAPRAGPGRGAAGRVRRRGPGRGPAADRARRGGAPAGGGRRAGRPPARRRAGVRVVVTSRVVLGAPGEVCWTVPPLECPSAAAGVADIAGSDAVQLFVARARERLPGFSVADVPPHAIGELCRRLDGLPLAIELIAGWVGALSVREILQQRAVLLDCPGAAPVAGTAAGGRRPGQLRPAAAGGAAAARRAQRVRRVIHLAPTCRGSAPPGPRRPT